MKKQNATNSGPIAWLVGASIHCLIKKGPSGFSNKCFFISMTLSLAIYSLIISNISVVINTPLFCPESGILLCSSRPPQTVHN